MKVTLSDIKQTLIAHKDALTLLGYLFLKSHMFRNKIEGLSTRNKIRCAIVMYLHFLPYMCVITYALRLSVTKFVSLPVSNIITDTAIGLLFGTVSGITSGVLVIAFAKLLKKLEKGVLLAISFAISYATTFTIFYTALDGIHVGIAGGIAFGISVGIAIGVLREKPIDIIAGIGFVLILMFAKIVVFASSQKIAEVIIEVIVVAGIALIAIFRAHYQVLHLFWIWPKYRGNLYRYHPVSWDSMCSLSFKNLDLLLVSYFEKKPQAAEKEVERLLTSYPSQKASALKALSIITARKSREAKNFKQVMDLVIRLPEGNQGFLEETGKIKQQVKAIYQKERQIEMSTSAITQLMSAEILHKTIETFSYSVQGFTEPLGSEFSIAAKEWCKISQAKVTKMESNAGQENIPLVFRAGGDYINKEQEAFVFRRDTFAELEKQVTQYNSCPIILYGRRRVGKTTLIRNLKGFLPQNIKLIIISMQDPLAFSSLSDFCTKILTEIQKVIPTKKEHCKDLKNLYSLMDEVSTDLVNTGRLVLIIDEYENIDMKLQQDVFPHDFLDVVRESIQSHRQITWVFCGSHEITELKYASWSSYLISAKTIEVPMFSQEETTSLLTEPFKHSSFQAASMYKNLTFTEKFWGIGIERIHQEAGGWPHLVQLLADTTIQILNDSGEKVVNTENLEKAFDNAIHLGHNFFYYLMHEESSKEEWKYICGFIDDESQQKPQDLEILYSLRRRKLVIVEKNLVSLRVPIMRRWLIKRAFN